MHGYQIPMCAGEGFDYQSQPPEWWLLQTSGIPFGMMGDMIRENDCPNPNKYYGMVFGMTTRLPGAHPFETKPIWKVQDAFGIAAARMVGWWDAHPVVTTNNTMVKATAFVREGNATLVAVASWDTAPDVAVTLAFDWAALGIAASEATIKAPYIEQFQNQTAFRVNGTVPVAARRGWLLIVTAEKAS